MRNKILMTLALLLTAVTGAWATVYSGQVSRESLQVGDILVKGAEVTSETPNYGLYGGSYKLNGSISSGLANVKKNLPVIGDDGLILVSTINFTPYDADNDRNGNAWKVVETGNQDYGVILAGTTYVASITVEPVTGKTNEWTFTMPAYDVEIAPIYAPVAQWAKDKEVDQIPAAIEGIFAGTTDAIVKAGTVAFAGQSTEVTQGIVMYAVTSTNQATAPEFSAFSADLPTAKDIADEGADVLVWYYIKGADTPQGETATAENTFNDSEICAKPIKVTVLSNKFDIQFTAANANTIEAGKATVTVGGTAATVTEGKLEGVKMGSEVKVTAKEGYKFRKVEVKEKPAGTTVTWSPVSCYGTYTQDGVTLTPSNGDAVNGNNFYQFGDNTFTTTLGKFIKIEIVFESTTYTFDGWTKGTAEQYQPDPHTYPDWWKNLLKLTWTGNADSVTIKGKDVFGIRRITFTIQ